MMQTIANEKMLPCSMCGVMFLGRTDQRNKHRMGYPVYCSSKCSNNANKERHNGGLSPAETRGKKLMLEHRQKRLELEALLEQRRQAGETDAPRTLTEAMLYQGHDEDFAPQKEPEPTKALPQTPEKILVLRARVEAGENLWHPQDAGVADSIASAESRLYSSLKSRRIANTIRTI